MLKTPLRLILVLYFMSGIAPTADAFFNSLLMKKRSTSTCDTANSGLVQTSSVSYFSSSSAAYVPFYSAQSSGNTNIVAFGWADNTTSVSSVSDDAGNTYTLALGPIRSSNSTLYIYYAKNIASSAAGNVITIEPSSWVALWGTVMEYRGLSTTSPIDTTSSGTGTTTAISTSSLTTTNACNVLLNAVHTNGRGSQTGTNFTNRANSFGNFVQDRVVSATGSYSASATQATATNYSSGLVALKKSAGTQALNSIRNVQWNAIPTPQASATSFTVRYLSPQSAGNLNVVVIGWTWNTGTVTSVTDTAGNTYTQIGSTIRKGNLSQAIYYAKNIAASAAGNAVTVALDFGQNASVQILEYQGLSTTSPLDQATSATGTSTTPTSPSVTTTSANELILGITRTSHSSPIVATAGSGFTAVSNDAYRNSNFVQEKVVSATGSYSSTTTNSSSADWISHIVTFK